MNKHTLLFASIFVLFTLVSQAQSNVDIIGNWSINTGQTISLMNSTQKNQYDSLSTEIQGQIKSQLESQSFTFNADSSFVVNVSGQSFNGTYEMINSRLNLTYSQGRSTSQTIESLNTNQMILRLIDDPNSQALIHKIHLEKTPN